VAIVDVNEAGPRRDSRHAGRIGVAVEPTLERQVRREQRKQVLALFERVQRTGSNIILVGGDGACD
jgi:hypothetical protein